jgi:ABC-2 type transport system permease protein
MMTQRIFWIAKLTFAEAVRAKFFSLLLLMALVLVSLAGFFQQFDFGASQLKFILDFSFGAVFLLGTILTLVMTTQTFYHEIQTRSIMSILARPIQRWEYLFGKLLGVQFLVLLFCLLTGVILTGLLTWEEHVLLLDSEKTNIVYQSEVFLFLGVQWLKFSVIASLTLFIACLSRSSLYAMFVAFLAIIACQLQYLAAEMYADAETQIGLWFAWFLKTVVPNLQIYNIGDWLVLESKSGELPEGTYLDILKYSAVWYLVFFGLAALFFKDREI